MVPSNFFLNFDPFPKGSGVLDSFKPNTAALDRFAFAAVEWSFFVFSVAHGLHVSRILSSVSDPPNSRALTCSKIKPPVINLIPQIMQNPFSRSQIVNLRLTDRFPRFVVLTSSIMALLTPIEEQRMLVFHPQDRPTSDLSSRQLL